MLHPRGNIAEFLLRDGLAKCLDWTKGLVTGSGEKLREAENFAKQRRVRIWYLYVFGIFMLAFIHYPLFKEKF